MKRCSMCGAPNDDASSACSQCGRDLAGVVSVPDGEGASSTGYVPPAWDAPSTDTGFAQPAEPEQPASPTEVPAQSPPASDSPQPPVPDVQQRYAVTPPQYAPPQQSVVPPPGPGGYGPPPVAGPGGYGPPMYAAAPRTSTTAQWALGLSIFGLCCCITAIIGLVLAGNAKREIAASGGAIGGAGIAQAAWIIGWVAIGLNVLSIVGRLALVGASGG